MQQLWLTGSRPSSRACASVLNRCSPADAALVLQEMSLHGPRITPHIIFVALKTLSASAQSLPSSSNRASALPRRFLCSGHLRKQTVQSVWLLESLHDCLHPYASALAALNVADVQLPRSLPLQSSDMHKLHNHVLKFIVAGAPASEVARISDSAPASMLTSSALPALVCRFAAENDAVRVVDLLTRPRGTGSCITRSIFNFTVRKLLAGRSTSASASVALLAARYWTACSARVLRALMHAVAAQPSLLHAGSYVASSFNSVADLLRSNVAPLYETQPLMFKAKNMATELRCSVMLGDEQESFKTASGLSSIASSPGASPAVVLECAKAMACTVGSHAGDPRASQLLQDLCCLPALKGESAVRACALEILSSRTQHRSVRVPSVQERAHKLQAACTLCVAKQYPLHSLAAEMQAGWAEDTHHKTQLSNLRLQVSEVVCFSVTSPVI